MDKILDPYTWYGNRELEFTPPHFVVTRTPLTQESKLWILNNLRGRFSTVSMYDDDTNQVFVLNFSDGVPAFENPKEAVLYELTWG